MKPNLKKMIKFLTLLAVLFLFHTRSFAQATEEKMFFIIDSIPVIDDPGYGNEISQNDIADLKIIRNKDTLKLLGYERMDGVTYIYTKEYRNRPENLKQIPSIGQMRRENGTWLFHNIPYTGKFIDYYYNGRKRGEGSLLNGTANGLRLMYYQNGKLSVERNYKEGIEDGLEKEYYEDGSLKQKGEFVDGKENGLWEMYFPNGQIKQKSNFSNGVMTGENIVYYSTGKILAVETIKNGKPIPDKNMGKIFQTMQRGHESSKDDYTAAIKNYTKAIELDSSYAEAYFSRGTVKLNEFQFDEAIADFDLALKYEPFMAFALTNRAFARIRKFQYGSGKTLLKNSDVTILTSKDKVPVPLEEQKKICNDLKKAMFLGDITKVAIEALADYCDEKDNL